MRVDSDTIMKQVPTLCPGCMKPLPVLYQELGVTIWCNNCLRLTIPFIPIGAEIPLSGSSITYTDFQQLISDNSARGPVEAALKNWFNFELSGAGRNETLILNQSQEAIDPVWVHRKIQSDKIKQSEIYNIAMSLWR